MRHMVASCDLLIKANWDPKLSYYQLSIETEIIIIIIIITVIECY